MTPRPLSRVLNLASVLIVGLTTLPALAVQVAFKAVADGVYAYVSDTEGLTCDDEGLNANIGQIVTSAGAALIDSGSSYQVAARIHMAVKEVTSQPPQLGLATAKGVLSIGDAVYVDRVLGFHGFNNSGKWLETFAVIEQLNPKLIVPGHGHVTDLATAQGQTRDLLQALRNHMKKAVDDGVDIGVDIGVAVKSFEPKPFAHLKQADVWIPQLANQTYLELERE